MSFPISIIGPLHECSFSPHSHLKQRLGMTQNEKAVLCWSLDGGDCEEPWNGTWHGYCWDDLIDSGPQPAPYPWPQNYYALYLQNCHLHSLSPKVCQFHLETTNAWLNTRIQVRKLPLSWWRWRWADLGTNRSISIRHVSGFGTLGCKLSVAELPEWTEFLTHNDSSRVFKVYEMFKDWFTISSHPPAECPWLSKDLSPGLTSPKGLFSL